MHVLEFLCDRRFHRYFTLPPNPGSGRDKPYHVSYADYGDPTSNAVVLLCGGLMGMRLSYSPLDQLAKAHHVRIIHPDRPGIGGSNAVEPDKRMETWLDVIPQLLGHLNIPHVSLASHSFGDVYLLNILLKYPYLLYPQNPYICFFTPWVHPSHSRVAHLRATALLPAPLIGKFASLATFVNDNITPLAGVSGGLVDSLKGSLPHSYARLAPVPLTTNTTRLGAPSISSCNHSNALDLNDPAVIDELRKLITTFLFAESMDGISADAQLCLKKPRSIPWCSPSMLWTDIDVAVPLLSKIINEDDRLIGHSTVWAIDVFHAEVDNMIGEKGKHWFDDCWTMDQTSTPSGQSSSSQPTQQPHQKSYDYRSTTVIGTTHDYIMDSAFGASELWLQRVREAVPVQAENEVLLDPQQTSP